MNRRALRLVMIAATLPATSAWAAPALQCRIEQAGEVKVIDVAPGVNPYTFKSFDIRGRFRFKAVVIGDEQHIEYVKLYVYYHAPKQPIMMHEAIHREPGRPAIGRTIQLTGTIRLFSPPLGREIQYSCDLIEAAG